MTFRPNSIRCELGKLGTVTYSAPPPAPCPPEKHYPGVLEHLLPSGVASILGAVSPLWGADEFLDSTG